MKNEMFKLTEKELSKEHFEDGKFEVRILKDARSFVFEGKFSGDLSTIELFNEYEGDDKLSPWKEIQIRLNGKSSSGVIKEIK